MILDKITMFTNYNYRKNDLIKCDNVKSKNMKKQKIKEQKNKKLFLVIFTNTWIVVKISKTTMNKSVLTSHTLTIHLAR